jgi:hypothetical protein
MRPLRERVRKEKEIKEVEEAAPIGLGTRTPRRVLAAGSDADGG